MQPPCLLAERLEDPAAGEAMYALAAEVFPICRSITGDGVRKTLRILSGRIALNVHEVPTGTPAFDWTVPQEWNIRDAYIKTASGERLVDFHANNLHVMSYSTPVHGIFGRDELLTHIHTLPDQPELIPYRTSYYKPDWGFCMAHVCLQALTDRHYEVCIDSTLADGSLTYGEYFHRGETDQEILLSAHVCHPSLANDNCSGLALLTHLAERLSGIRTRYGYRFIFAPGTIGAIVWLSRNEHRVPHIEHGLVMSCVGDAGGPVYKKSRRGDAAIDRAMAQVLRHATSAGRITEFVPYGYDERQYCSPGFDLPVGLFQRSQFGTFPEYHTSADNLDLIRPEHLAQSYRIVVDVLDVLEHDARLRNTLPRCEPQLGRRGLYAAIGGGKDGAAQSMAMLWVLNMSDTTQSLLDIAERANMPFAVIRQAAWRLLEHGLLVPADRPSPPDFAS